MMVNFDMVGRLNDKDELTMFGTGTVAGPATRWSTSLGKSSGLKIKKVAGMTDGIRRQRPPVVLPHDIPVLFAFTGVHRDYHRPSDDTDRINFAGMARIADYLELLAARRRPAPRAPGVTPGSAERRDTRAADPGRMGSSAYLGTMPDYGDDVRGRDEAPGRQRGQPGREGRAQGRRRHHRPRRQEGRHDLRLHGGPRHAQARR